MAAPSPKAAETRQRIIDAAQSLFAERGYDGATTASIAAAAGVAEKTLFKYFTSKKELLVDSIYPALLSLLQLPALNDRDVPLREALQAVVQDRLHFAHTHPALFRLLIQELVLRDDFRAAMQERWESAIYPALTALLRTAQARGELRAVRPAAITRALVGATVAQACIGLIFAPKAETDLEHVAAEIADTLLQGVADDVCSRCTIPE